MKLGVIMDPVSGINIKKDTTFAMMLAACARGWELHYMEQGDLFVSAQRAWAATRIITVRDDKSGWYGFHGRQTLPLAELDAVPSLGALASDAADEHARVAEPGLKRDEAAKS